jgi:hypothetical protein
VNFPLSTPLRCVGRAEVYLHLLLTSALNGGELSTLSQNSKPGSSSSQSGHHTGYAIPASTLIYVRFNVGFLGIGKIK